MAIIGAIICMISIALIKRTNVLFIDEEELHEYEDNIE